MLLSLGAATLTNYFKTHDFLGNYEPISTKYGWVPQKFGKIKNEYVI